MTARRTWLVLGLIAALAALAASPAFAQARANLTGTVSDSRGTKLRGVTVTARNRETGTERSATTGPDGSFTIGGLTPGTYDVTVSDPGYVAFKREVMLTADKSEPVDIQLGYTVQDFVPVTDRWRLPFPTWQRYPADLEGEYPFIPNRGLNPYEQNVLKGDLPVIGNNTFIILTAIAEFPFEFRTTPTPPGVSTNEPDGEQFFGQEEQYATLPTGIFSFEMFHGSTTFKPRDWAFRITPVYNLNYVNTKERNGLNISPAEGPTRRRTDFAIQEAFGEVKLFDVGANYDFVSFRGGIQPFTSDFRGFLFRDTNLGARFFGNWGRNRNQWNVAWFNQLEKETNSELNLTGTSSEKGNFKWQRRDQQVFIANYFRQDFLTLGYTISPSFHANLDKAFFEDPEEALFFDANGFLVRPSPIGLIRPHEVKAYYVGFAGDGHWGRINVTHQFYQAFGKDEFNGISGQPVDINAQFAAAEFSIDKDWWRPRVSVTWASGDSDPDDDEGKGFDTILDNPNFSGGQFSFWQRQGLRLFQTFIGIKGRNSLVPSLRSSKTEGQANFVNPGVLLVNAGWDADLTPKLRISTNANWVRLDKTEVIQRLLFQGEIDKNVGIDASVGLQWRPLLVDNLVVTGGISVFKPSSGFKQILKNGTFYSPFLVATLTY
jgi:carboxypeptidase family protein